MKKRDVWKISAEGDFRTVYFTEAGVPGLSMAAGYIYPTEADRYFLLRCWNEPMQRNVVLSLTYRQVVDVV